MPRLSIVSIVSFDCFEIRFSEPRKVLQRVRSFVERCSENAFDGRKSEVMMVEVMPFLLFEHRDYFLHNFMKVKFQDLFELAISHFDIIDYYFTFVDTKRSDYCACTLGYLEWILRDFLSGVKKLPFEIEWKSRAIAKIFGNMTEESSPKWTTARFVRGLREGEETENIEGEKLDELLTKFEKNKLLQYLDVEPLRDFIKWKRSGGRNREDSDEDLNVESEEGDQEFVDNEEESGKDGSEDEHESEEDEELNYEELN